jgi:L-2,4-diaminobutyrate decarboxylase
LWFHVDGAHGASALLSQELKPMLQGIGLADSVVWDGHKLLYMPAAVSAVLFREPRNSYAAFAQEASYLFQENDSEEAYNFGMRTLECTKRMMGLKLWAAFMLYGTEKLGGLVERVFGTARQLASMLQQAEDFELLMQPQTNIVCFRYAPEDLEGGMLDRHQETSRRKLVESGSFHLTQVKLGDASWLRTTVMNPLTSEDDLNALIHAMRSLH